MKSVFKPTLLCCFMLMLITACRHSEPVNNTSLFVLDKSWHATLQKQMESRIFQSIASDLKQLPEAQSVRIIRIMSEGFSQSHAVRLLAANGVVILEQKGDEDEDVLKTLRSLKKLSNDLDKVVDVGTDEEAVRLSKKAGKASEEAEAYLMLTKEAGSAKVLKVRVELINIDSMNTLLDKVYFCDAECKPQVVALENVENSLSFSSSIQTLANSITALNRILAELSGNPSPVADTLRKTSGKYLSKVSSTILKRLDKIYPNSPKVSRNRLMVKHDIYYLSTENSPFTGWAEYKIPSQLISKTYYRNGTMQAEWTARFVLGTTHIKNITLSGDFGE